MEVEGPEFKLGPSFCRAPAPITFAVSLRPWAFNIVQHVSLSFTECWLWLGHCAKSFPLVLFRLYNNPRRNTYYYHLFKDEEARTRILNRCGSKNCALNRSLQTPGEHKARAWVHPSPGGEDEIWMSGSPKSKDGGQGKRLYKNQRSNFTKERPGKY